MFSSNKRDLKMVFKKTTTTSKIPTYQYNLATDYFSNTSYNKNNEGFCVKDYCLNANGILNMTSCLGSK